MTYTEVVLIGMWTWALRAVLRQVWAHVLVAHVQRRIRDIPGDRMVAPSPGLDEPICRAWGGDVIPMQRRWQFTENLGLIYQRHPRVFATFEYLPIGSASSHDLRALMHTARQLWIDARELALIHAANRRVSHLSCWKDVSGDDDRGGNSRSDPSPPAPCRQAQ